MLTNNTEHLAEFVLGMNETAITRIFDHYKNKELMDAFLKYHKNTKLGDITAFKDRLDTLYERRLLAGKLASILSNKHGTTSEELQGYRDQSDYYRGLYSTLYNLTKSYKPPK